MEMRSEPTPAWGSGNSTTWEEYLDIALLVANCFVLLITSFVGIAANLFVTWAVYHQKSLRTWNNALLVNLAVVDIFRCAVDCPILLTIVMTVHHRGHVDELICDAQVASFSFSCCIQLLTLACISAERYQAIAYPFKTSQRRRRIIVLIPLTWTLAILVAVVCLTFVKDSPVYVECQGSRWETIPSYDTFGLYILFPLWTTCFIVIIAFYARIFIIVRAHSRKIFDKGTFALSKKDNTKNSNDEQKKEDAMGGGKGHGESDQNQTQRETVAQVEQGTQAETNSSNKDSTAALLDSMKEPQGVLSGSENQKQFKATVKIAEPHPLVVLDEPNLSTGEMTTGLKSSTTEPPRVPTNLANKRQFIAKVQIDEAPTEMEQTSPHVSSAPQLDNPEAHSILLVDVEQDKSNNEQRKEDAMGGEKGHGESDQNQTQRETVAQAEQGAQAETNSSNKDSTAALLDSTKEPQGVLSGSENQKQFKAAVKIAEPHPLVMPDEPNSSIRDTTVVFRSSLTEPQRISKELDNKNDLEAKVRSDDAPTEMKQPSHHVMQVKRKSSNGDTTTRTSTTEPQRVLNNLNNKSCSKATVQTTEAPSKTEQPKHQAMQVKPKSSNGEMTTGLKSSATEPPRVPTNLANKRQSIAKVQIDEAPTEMEQTSPHVSSAPQLDNPEAHAILLVDVEQDKSNNEGEKLSVAKADQVSSLPQTANIVPETEAKEQIPEMDGAVCMMPSFANKERSSNKKESKMAKRSGYIILTFLLFWLPLLATILVNFLVNKNISGGAGMWIVRDVEILSVSFACMTSLSDPIIYAAVNPQFRTEFYKIRNRFKSLWNKNDPC